MSVKLLVIILLSLCLAIITLSAAEGVDASKVSPSIAQVVKMHESGVAGEVLLAYVRETPISKPTAEEVLYLTEKGIPKDVIVTLLSKRVWSDTPPAQSQPAAAPAPAQQQQQLPPAVTTTPPATQSVVYVQPPVAYVGAPAYYPYYYPYYPWPRVSIGLGFGYGYGWYGGHHWHGHGHGHHGGGIHVRRR